MRCVWLQLSAAGLALATAEAANAQSASDAQTVASSTGRTTVYDAAFFKDYSPRTALDIVQRVPAFAFDAGDSEIRGFAGAAGNVVINGARPSAKSDTLQTQLARIPASRVLRVEVGSGDLFGTDYAGRAQVANVVLSNVSGIDGNVTVSGNRLWTGKVVPNVSGSALIKRGASTINLSAGTERQDQVEEGSDTLTDPASGELVEFRRKINRYDDRDPYLSASYALEQAPDRSVRANVRWSPGTFYLVQDNRVTPAGGLPRRDDLVQDFAEPVIEVGGDITRPLAGGAIKLVGLATRRQRDNVETYRFRRDGQTLGGFENSSEAKRNETIGRLSWTRANLFGASFEAGGEAVLNTLDFEGDLFVLGPGGDRTRIDLPIDNADVQERRGELFVNVGRSITPALRVDAALNYEFSRLKVRGDAQADRSLRFLKPSLTLDWKIGGGWHTQMVVRRRVAQLDFYDFISAAELSTDRVNGGNADLQPQRSWEVRATVDRPLLGDGQLKLEAGYDRISLLQDRILTEEGFDAPGNIGTGTRSFAALTIDTPLDRLGLKGVRTVLFGQLQRTRVDDPINGRPRDFSGFWPSWQWRFEARRDVGRWSYGLTVNDRDRFAFFRTDEIDTNFNSAPYGTAFVEFRPRPRTTVTLDVDNLFDTQARRERLLYDPNRTAPLPDLFELRERNRHVSFALSLKQTFGRS